MTWPEIPFVAEKTRTIVSSSHGAPVAGSRMPPQRSATNSPRCWTATAAPISPRVAKFRAKTSASRSHPGAMRPRTPSGRAAEAAGRVSGIALTIHNHGLIRRKARGFGKEILQKSAFHIEILFHLANRFANVPRTANTKSATRERSAEHPIGRLPMDRRSFLRTSALGGAAAASTTLAAPAYAQGNRTLTMVTSVPDGFAIFDDAASMRPASSPR
jgi:hypothetical protein